jgi:hypothetical protein
MDIANRACPCDVQETAEAYYRKTLSPGEVEAFATHLSGCAICRAEVESARQFVTSMKAAASRMRCGGTLASHEGHTD